ncbi:MAG TPA: GntR family transcriptional regulator [Planctomycetota bacterium]
MKEPIYQQLNRELRKLPGQPGDRFLTEREISSRFGVSRATANKALASLVAEGLLEFRKGLGTFVRGGTLDVDLRALVSFTDRARAAGKRPSTRVLRLESLPGPVLRMERLRLVDDVPVILERRDVMASLCPDLEKKELSGSLYALWTETYGLKLEGAEQSIRAVAVEGADARTLQVAPGAAGLLVTATGRVAGGAILWTERTLYRGDAYEFRNRLGAAALGSLL